MPRAPSYDHRMPDSSHRVRVIEIEQEPTLAFDAYGVRVAVSANDPALLARVEEILPPGSRRCDGGRRRPPFQVHAKDGGRFDLQVEYVGVSIPRRRIC